MEVFISSCDGLEGITNISSHSANQVLEVRQANHDSARLSLQAAEQPYVRAMAIVCGLERLLERETDPIESGKLLDQLVIAKEEVISSQEQLRSTPGYF